MTHGDAPYDPVAMVYDRYWGDEFLSHWQTAAELHLEPRLRRGAKLLDLCCGTGKMLDYFSTRGFDVWGVDNSPEMLSIARQHAPHVHLVRADMAAFCLPVRIDAAVSFYNSLNHAQSEQHLRTALRQVASHLAPDGLLLFDYILPEAFETTWEWLERVDDRWTFRYTYDRASGRAACVINDHHVIRQTAFDSTQLHAAVAAAGMAVEFDISMAETRPAGGRRLVLCTGHS